MTKNGEICGIYCKHFHGECKINDEGQLKIVEWCDKCNEAFLTFQKEYGDKNASWVNNNVTMKCFTMAENFKPLNETLDDDILLDNNML